MTRRTLIRIIVAVAIAIVLGGASLILWNSGGAPPNDTVGFLH
jgi:hypothetical protein